MIILRNNIKKENKTLINKKDYSFSILIDIASQTYLDLIMEKIKVNNLTVYGDGSNKLKKTNRTPFLGVNVSDTLVFGKSNEFDVELASKNRILYGNIGNTKPGYKLSSDIWLILNAIDEFAMTKKKLLKNSNLNTVSRVVNEITNIPTKEAKKEKKIPTKKVEITVSSGWIRIGNQFFEKNAADTVNVIDNNSVTTVRGCYS